MKLPRLLTLLFLLCCVLPGLHAKVVLPTIFSDHMVLQQNTDIKVWGWSYAFQKVTVTPSWDPGAAVETRAPRSGHWEVTLHTPTAGGPYSLVVEGENDNKLAVNDILIGEVWFASGQSNMELSGNTELDMARQMIEGTAPKTCDTDKLKAYLDKHSTEAAKYPQIRYFKGLQTTAETPQDYILGDWTICDSESMMNNSLVAYFFATHLTEIMNGVPIGIIQSTWGGTCAETWTPEEAVYSVPEVAELWKDRPEMKWAPYQPGRLYNAMIHPWTNFKIRGLIWCQGEENASLAKGSAIYDTLFSTLVDSWRKQWGYDFPVYYVQIAPYRYNPNDPKSCAGTIVRDMQRSALDLIPNSAMVVIDDVGNIEDIHPKYKDQVGKRLATWALNKTYGLTDEIPCGPLYDSMSIEGDKIRLSFKYSGDQLSTSDGKQAHCFTIAGEDQVFHPATASIDGNTVIVNSPEVANPVAVRMAWLDTDESNLVSSTGLPASCFRTDDWALEKQ